MFKWYHCEDPELKEIGSNDCVLLRSWYLGLNWVVMFSSSEDMVLSHAPKFCSNTSTTYKVLTQCLVWKIWCVNGDEWQRMDVWRKLNEGWIEVGRKSDGCGIKIKQMSNGKWMNIKRKLDGHRMENGQMSNGSWMKIRKKNRMAERQNSRIVERQNCATTEAWNNKTTKPWNGGT